MPKNHNLYTDVLNEARLEPDVLAESEALTWLGYTAWKAFDLDEPIRLGEESRKTWTELLLLMGIS